LRRRTETPFPIKKSKPTYKAALIDQALASIGQMERHPKSPAYRRRS
jgi:hypothetical protein